MLSIGLNWHFGRPIKCSFVYEYDALPDESILPGTPEIATGILTQLT